MKSLEDSPLKYEQFYRPLYLIRRVEEEIAKVYPTDKIKSPIHLSLGQESISVGVCAALRHDDIVFGTYRSHALYLAKGGDLNRMIAELYGKATGCAKGKGGSMHLIDTQAGVMGTSAIVGSTIPQAVGYAYAMKFYKRDSVVVSFFGDGAVEEGVFHESLNFAALKELPVVFVCENNLYAVHSHQKERQSMTNISERGRAYNIPSVRIDDSDVGIIYEKMRQAIEEIRTGGCGPRLFECMTYRWKEHVGPQEDYEAGYRSKREAEPWLKKDHVKNIGGLLEPEERLRIESEVEDEVRKAFEFAEQSPFPDDDELYSDVFAEA